MGAVRIGVDSGGTFTDVCLFDEASGRAAVWKVPSTPADPSEAIVGGAREALARFGGDDPAVAYFGHGTTVATNALIQGRGARAGLITNEGFRDLLEIGRQRRPHLYDLQAGRGAGVATVHVASNGRGEWPDVTDIRVHNVGEILNYLESPA